MSGAADETRRYLLAYNAGAPKRDAQRAVARAERMHARIEELYESGAEPSPELAAEFAAACEDAERLLLEAGILNTLAGEPGAEGREGSA